MVEAAVYTATTPSMRAKARVSLAASIPLEIRVPTTTPTVTVTRNGPTTAQSKPRSPERIASAVAALMTMTTNDVPIACLAGNLRSRVSAGTTAKPPPTPKRPVRSPTAVAAPASFARAGADRSRRGALEIRCFVATPVPLARWGSSTSCSFAGSDLSILRYIRTATKMMSAEKASSRAFSSNDRFTSNPILEPKIPAAPKARPAPRRTLPLRKWLTTPNADATPTTSNEAVVASWACRPATNTRIGTASVDPPPPSAPSDSPTRRPSATAMISPVTPSLESRDAWGPDAWRMERVAA